MPDWLEKFITLWGPLGMGWVIAILMAKDRIDNGKAETEAKVNLAVTVRGINDTLQENTLALREMRTVMEEFRRERNGAKHA